MYAGLDPDKRFDLVFIREYATHAETWQIAGNTGTEVESDHLVDEWGNVLFVWHTFHNTSEDAYRFARDTLDYADKVRESSRWSGKGDTVEIIHLTPITSIPPEKRSHLDNPHKWMTKDDRYNTHATVETIENAMKDGERYAA